MGAASGTRASAGSGSRAATETPEQQTAREAQYEKRMEPYFKRHTIYRDNLRQWEKYNECEAKPRERILGTLAQQKAAPLVPQNTVRKWLIDLKASTEPPKATVKQGIRVEYQRLMSVGFVEWPTGGPNSWLAKWEDLVYRAKQYDEPLLNWLTDVSMVLLNKKSTRHTAAGCRRRGSRAIKDRQREVLGKRDAGTPYFQ